MMKNIAIRTEVATLRDSEIRAVWQMGFSIPDVVGLWVGESDIPTPAFICDAATQALAEGKTFYTHQQGIPRLRQAIADYYGRIFQINIEVDRIAVTSAGMNAAMIIVETLIAPGDNIVGITPSWPNIFRCAEIMGGTYREVALTPDHRGWHLNLDEVFAACDSRTKAIYLASPGNPTGWVFDKTQAKTLLEFAKNRGIAIISDEVYHRLIYSCRAAPSFLEVAEPDDPVFIINSFSKTWCMTGWRIGWMVMPKGLGGQMERLIGFNTSGGQAFLQEACVTALQEGEEWVATWVQRCRQGREYVLDRLRVMKRVSVVPSDASFYLMLEVDGMGDSIEFCKRMVVESKVGLAPGLAFGKGGEKFVRLCYAQSREKLEKGMDRLERFLAQ